MAFHPVQRSTTNPHPLADFEERVRRHWNLLFQEQLNIFDLAVWNRESEIADADEIQYASTANLLPGSGMRLTKV